MPSLAGAETYSLANSHVLVPLVFPEDNPPVVAEVGPSVDVLERAHGLLEVLNNISWAGAQRGLQKAVKSIPGVQERLTGDPTQVAQTAYKHELGFMSTARAGLYKVTGYAALIESGLIDQAEADRMEVSIWRAFRTAYQGKEHKNGRAEYRNRLEAVIKTY